MSIHCYLFGFRSYMCFVSKYYIFTVVLCARNRQLLALDDYNVSGVERIFVPSY